MKNNTIKFEHKYRRKIKCSQRRQTSSPVPPPSELVETYTSSSILSDCSIMWKTWCHTQYRKYTALPSEEVRSTDRSTGNMYRKFGEICISIYEICERTDRHADALIATLRTLNGVEVMNKEETVSCCWRFDAKKWAMENKKKKKRAKKPARWSVSKWWTDESVADGGVSCSSLGGSREQHAGHVDAMRRPIWFHFRRMNSAIDLAKGAVCTAGPRPGA